MLQRVDQQDDRTTSDARRTPRSLLNQTTDADDGLLRVAGPLMAVCYSIAFGAAWLTFRGSSAALFPVAISICFAVMYFTIPILLIKVRNRHDARWRSEEAERTSASIEIHTGRLTRFEALTQMLIVPIAVAFAFVCFGTIWTILGS